MDNLIWKKFPVLDDGFICLVDVMGSDAAICQAARVSYGKGTRSVSDDCHLLRYLIRHKHLSPLEMCELKFLWRAPMDVWRQVVRHRTASINEYSTRYSVAIDSASKALSWRKQAQKNKQGSGDKITDPATISALTASEQKLQYAAKTIYKERLDLGVAREQARKDLPLSTYTEAYWKIDLRNLLHFLALRMDNHAQYEIRQYANIIGNEIVARLFPFTWEAFNEYQFNSITFSVTEQRLLFSVLSQFTFDTRDELLNLLVNCADVPSEWKQKKFRERDEFIEKVFRLKQQAEI